MKDWTEGYVTEIGYTYGYYAELNPVRARWALLNAGLVPPGGRGQPYTACELGFGQGISINIHAAATPGQWWGTDFNPAQTAFAQQLAAASGAPAQLCDDAFAEFAQRTDLPAFDFIGLHGIWSWVSDENRRVIVDFLRRHLKVGGVAYISYNTLPGWANGMPLRHLMTEHARAMAPAGTSMASRIDAALDFCEKLFATDPMALRGNPVMKERLQRMKGQNRSYLAHEYFNQDWEPMYFSQLQDWLEPAKLTFAASANVLDHLRSVMFSPEQAKLLDEISDPALRETMRDFYVNQQFRKDLWVRGAQRMTPAETAEAMRAERVVLLQNAAQVSLKVNSPRGEMSLSEAIYRPVLEALADQRPRSLRELEGKLQGKLNLGQLREVVTVLVGSGALGLAQDDETAQACRGATDRFNAAVCRLSRSRQDLTYLASPVTGGGYAVSRFAQLFLASRSQHAADPAAWARSAWEVLSAQGERLLKDGKAIESAEANLDELTKQAHGFATVQLPILKGLQIA